MNLNNKSLVLASSSVYRRALLGRLHIAFTWQSPNVDETAVTGELPRDTALRLSVAKARAIAHTAQHAVVIGSDQVAELDGLPIGKPETAEEARRQLNAASGKALTFHSGLAVIDADSGHCESCVVPTRVTYRTLSFDEIARYVAKEPALDCAGAAKIEGLGITLVESVDSVDPTALVGLPLIALARMLRRAGWPLP